jgi:hypothetical protein
MRSRLSPGRTTFAAASWRLLFRAVFPLFVVAFAGCGQGDRPQLGTVQGVVTLDGKPLPNAAVRFLPVVPLRASMSMTDPAGRYELVYIRDIMGAAVGDHRVEITTEGAGTQEKLPAEYHSKTTLTAKVEPGGNEINFDLKSGPAK